MWDEVEDLEEGVGCMEGGVRAKDRMLGVRQRVSGRGKVGGEGG